MESINDKLNKLKAEYEAYSAITKSNKCFIENCENQTIKSHTLSKSRILDYIEDKNEKGIIVVYHLDDIIEVDFNGKTISTYQKLKRKLVQKSKKESSIFYGYCSYHDNQIFEEIDNSPYLNNHRVNFLHCLRAYSYFISSKENLTSYHENKIIPGLKNNKESNLSIDKNLKIFRETLDILNESHIVTWEECAPYLPQIAESINIKIESSLFLNKAELHKKLNDPLLFLQKKENYPMSGNDLKIRFNDFFEIQEKSLTNAEINDDLISGLQKNIEFDRAEFKKIKTQLNKILSNKEFDRLPYLYVSLNDVFPITGNFVFNLNDSDLFSLTFFPEKETGKTHFIFSALDKTNYQDKIFSHINIMTNNEIKRYISSLIITAGTNVYFSPRYWHKLDSTIQEKILSKKDLKPTEYFSINLFDDYLKEYCFG